MVYTASQGQSLQLHKHFLMLVLGPEHVPVLAFLPTVTATVRKLQGLNCVSRSPGVTVFWEVLVLCSYLGEALRALLVLEVRQLTVLSHKPTQRIPAHLPSGCTAICCQIQTAAKAQAQVVLGGPHAGERAILKRVRKRHVPWLILVATVR